MTVDFWIALVLPTLFLTLIGPVKGWPWGSRSLKRGLAQFGVGKDGWTAMSESEAFVVCALVCWGIFLLRAVYNLGSIRSAWNGVFGKKKKVGKKIKRA